MQLDVEKARGSLVVLNCPYKCECEWLSVFGGLIMFPLLPDGSFVGSCKTSGSLL